MFVSPPPATSKNQVLQRRPLESTNSNHGFASSLQAIPENTMSGSDNASFQSLPLSMSSSQSTTSSRRENFVNAPPEYTDRARDEIKKDYWPPHLAEGHIIQAVCIQRAGDQAWLKVGVYFRIMPRLINQVYFLPPLLCTRN